MKAETHYEYRFEDHSIVLRAVERPLLVPFVRALPRWLTPNQITLAGQAAALVAFVVAVAVHPMNAGGFVVVAAAAMFFNFADAIDGLHARHSQQTSRLGELLDHWLDAYSVPLVVLTFALVLGAPAGLTFWSVVATGVLHYMTVLHGFRLGFVHLGAIGIVEGACVGSAACVVAAILGPQVFTRPLVGDFSLATLLLGALVAGGGLALWPMRRVFRRPADFAAITALLAAIAGWHARGDLPLPLAGLLVVATTAWFEGQVLRARLLQLPFAWHDPVMLGLALCAATASVAFDLSPAWQSMGAAVVAGYALGSSGIALGRSVRALRAAPAPVSVASAAAVAPVEVRE